jgi:hypothetical protein
VSRAFLKFVFSDAWHCGKYPEEILTVLLPYTVSHVLLFILQELISDAIERALSLLLTLLAETIDRNCSLLMDSDEKV